MPVFSFWTTLFLRLFVVSFAVEKWWRTHANKQRQCLQRLLKNYMGVNRGWTRSKCLCNPRLDKDTRFHHGKSPCRKVGSKDISCSTAVDHFKRTYSCERLPCLRGDRQNKVSSDQIKQRQHLNPSTANNSVHQRKHQPIHHPINNTSLAAQQYTVIENVSKHCGVHKTSQSYRPHLTTPRTIKPSSILDYSHHDRREHFGILCRTTSYPHWVRSLVSSRSMTRTPPPRRALRDETTA